jgi:hypothetical protein
MYGREIGFLDKRRGEKMGKVHSFSKKALMVASGKVFL